MLSQIRATAGWERFLLNKPNFVFFLKFGGVLQEQDLSRAVVPELPRSL